MHIKRFGGLRDIVLKRDKYKCVICKMSQKKHLNKYGRSLNIDHIDGNGRNSPEPNNTLDNLQTLCQVCNARKGYYESRGLEALLERK